MVEITKHYVDQSPFGGYVELRASVQAMVRVDEEAIDIDGMALQCAANQCYRILLEQMNGFEIKEQQ